MGRVVTAPGTMDGERDRVLEAYRAATSAIQWGLHSAGNPHALVRELQPA